MSELPDRPDNRSVRPSMTAFERSLRPSCLLTAGVLIGIVLLFRVRLPPMPYSLLVLLGLALVCFLVVFYWQQRRPPR